MTRKIIVSLFTAVLLSGCSLSEIQVPQIEEGVLTKVSMDFNAGTSQVYTRAAQSSGSEFYVENLYILIFDNNDGHKRLMTTDDRGNTLAFFTETAGLTVTQGNQSSPTNGSVAFNVPSARSATVIAIANVGISATRYSLTKEQLDGISTLDELKSLVVKVDNTISRGNRFLMAGYGEKNRSTDIPISNNNGSSNNLCDITLKRVDAKIEVDITCEVPSGKNWTGMSFSPKTWKIVNVPQQSRLLPYTKDGIAGPWEDTDEGTMNVWDASTGPDGSQASYYQTSEYEFETDATYEEDNTVYSKGGGFTFYMPENRKRFKKSSATYADRDKFEGSNPVNANDHSTYMVLTGFLTYKDNGTNQTVNADARYIVHLGGLSSSFDDYDTKQNGHYKYSITIKGINNIVTEVTNDNEVRPGYEGDVVYSTETFELDAHYETRLLEIPVNADFDKMTWSVWTHFSSGTYNGGNDYTNIQDYKWIKFAFNSHFETRHGQFVRFPGIGHYDATRTAKELAQAVEGGKKPLFDIDQLIKYLQYINNPSSLTENTGVDDHICITAFVDEYIYLSDPEEKGGQDKLLFWKECVDIDDRQLHILSGSRNVSTDGNSSVTEALYTFRQKSIRTVYNKDAPDLQTAWGLETVIEQAVNKDNPHYNNSNRLPPGVDDIGSGSSDNRNGRKNTVNIIGSHTDKWYEIVDSKDNTLKGGYQSAAYACMLRNRDEDGDGEIEESEIRWYLAAIDQLTDIYIGEWALNTASRLYPNNRPGGNGPYWHYTSSSYNSEEEEGAPWVLWAEEGASRGSYDSSKERNGEYYSYRCVRNLGIDVNDTDKTPQDLVEPEGDGLGPYTFNLSRLNPKSLREYPVTGRQATHTHDQDINRPYIGFKMLAETRNSSGDAPYYIGSFRNDNYWNAYQENNNACPDGYRVPNQRELLIMSTRLPDDAWETYGTLIHGKATYMSYTAFALNNQFDYEHRDGFMYNAETRAFTLQNWEKPTFPWGQGTIKERGYVRCIQDIDPQP